MILAITESTTPLTVHSLGMLLRARLRRERAENYWHDLLYLLAKPHYEGLTPASDAAMEIMKPPGKPKTAGDVISDIRRKLRE